MQQKCNSCEHTGVMWMICLDTGELESIKKFVPVDATTNPSLLLAACSDPKYDVYVQDVR